MKFDEFLGAYLGERPGNIVDAHNGNVIGRHRGLWFHTVGQVKISNDKMHFLTQKIPNVDYVFRGKESETTLIQKLFHRVHGTLWRKIPLEMLFLLQISTMKVFLNRRGPIFMLRILDG